MKEEPPLDGFIKANKDLKEAMRNEKRSGKRKGGEPWQLRSSATSTGTSKPSKQL